MLRIAYITACGEGGVADYLGKLTSNLNAEITVVGPAGSRLQSKIGYLPNVEYIGLLLTTKPHDLRDLRYVPFIRQLLRRREYDIVHSKNYKGGLISALARPGGIRTRFIYSPHCTMRHILTIPGVNFFSNIERWVARRHDFLIAVCKSEGTELLESGMARQDNLRMVSSGVEKGEVPKRCGRYRSQLGLGMDHYPVIGTICRLHRQKGLKHLIGSVREASRIYPGIKLLIAGDGPMEEELKEFTYMLGMEKQVAFLGHIDDCYELLSDLDVFVLSSLWEALPVTIMEAGVAQLPVVATDVGGIRELINDSTGWLAPADNTTGLSAMLVKCLSNRQEAQKRALNLYNRVLADYLFEDKAKDTLAIYHELTNVSVMSVE